MDRGMKILTEKGDEVMKKPAGNKGMLAIMNDEAEPSEGGKSKDSKSVKKRPAAAIIDEPTAADSSTGEVSKKPSALTPEALNAHNKEADEQNDKLNVCVRGSTKQMYAQSMVMEEIKYGLENIHAEGRSDQLKDLPLEEITEKFEELNKVKLEMRGILFGNQGTEHTDLKATKLTEVGGLLVECKECVLDAKHFLKSHGAGSSAGSIAG